MKNKILEYLFRGYTNNIKEKANESADLKFEAYKRTLDVKDLIRDRYKGIRINRYDDNTLLEDHLASLDDNTRLAFLGKAYDIVKNNETFKVLVNSLLVEQEHAATFEATDMAEVNFARATANGIMLLEGELSRLSSIYISEKDKNNPMTEEEKHAIIN